MNSTDNSILCTKRSAVSLGALESLLDTWIEELILILVPIYHTASFSELKTVGKNRVRANRGTCPGSWFRPHHLWHIFILQTCQYQFLLKFASTASSWDSSSPFSWGEKNRSIYVTIIGSNLGILDVGIFYLGLYMWQINFGTSLFFFLIYIFNGNRFHGTGFDFFLGRGFLELTVVPCVFSAFGIG